MVIHNPHMLPKVRSEKLMQAVSEMPCTLRIGTFIGIPCAHQSTVVGAHLPASGKGTSTKVSDLHVCAACVVCHSLLDGADKRGLVIRERYPQAFWEAVTKAGWETQDRWVLAGLITVPDMEII